MLSGRSVCVCVTQRKTKKTVGSGETLGWEGEGNVPHHNLAKPELPPGVLGLCFSWEAFRQRAGPMLLPRWGSDGGCPGLLGWGLTQALPTHSGCLWRGWGHCLTKVTASAPGDHRRLAPDSRSDSSSRADTASLATSCPSCPSEASTTQMRPLKGTGCPGITTWYQKWCQPEGPVPKHLVRNTGLPSFIRWHSSCRAARAPWDSSLSLARANRLPSGCRHLSEGPTSCWRSRCLMSGLSHSTATCSPHRCDCPAGKRQRQGQVLVPGPSELKSQKPVLISSLTISG